MEASSQRLRRFLTWANTGLCLVFMLTAIIPANQVSGQEVPWPTKGWKTASLVEQGLAAPGFEQLDQEIKGGRYGYVDRIVLVRNGRLILDKTYTNNYWEISKGHQGDLGCGHETCSDSSEVQDFNYYHPSRHPFYRGRQVHSLQSVTKSVSATLIGIAIARDQIKGVEVPFLSFFEDYDLSRVDPRLHGATLADLLTMRSGIEWHEQDRPLNDSNTTLQLEKSPDWIQFTLNQPMDANPGEKWVYNSGGSHLMSGIIKKTTGQFIDEYAQEHLFGPLGIRDFHWKKTPKGYPDTEGGLYLEALDLAKIGYLYLNDGIWEGGRILPEGWVAAATAKQAERINRRGWGYGYQWWRPDVNGREVWAGLGFGGQFLLVLPDFNIVGVVNSWNIFGTRQPNVGMAFLRAIIAAIDE